jgi:hypothetical protein
MRIIVPAILATIVTLASPNSGVAAEKQLVSPPLSINPNEGQPLCLVTNLHAEDTVAVTVEIVDGTAPSPSPRH